MVKDGARGAAASERVTPGANYHTQALTRGLGIIDTIAARPGEPMTLSELHETTELPKSTLVRLLAALSELDYLARVDDRPAYRLGYKVGALAAAYLGALDLEDLVGEDIEKLATRTRQTANLAVLDGTDIVHVAVCIPDRVLRYTVSVGDRAPARLTGLGKAILSRLSDDEVTAHLEPEPWTGGGSQASSCLAELRGELTRTRERGYAVDDNEFAEGLFCVAIPLLAEGQVVGGLSVSGPSGEFSPAKQSDVLEALQETARRLTSRPPVLDALADVDRVLRRS